MRKLPPGSEKEQARRYRKWGDYRWEARKSKLGGTRGEKITARKREKASRAVKRRFRKTKKLHILRCTAYRAGKGT